MVPIDSRVQRVLLLCAAILVCAGIVLARPAPADAHAFLIRSNPPPGARLARAPHQLVLDFSEALVSSAVRVSVREANGAVVPLPRPSVRGSVAEQPLPSSLHGVYVVSWRVVSADDGHLTDGELAFAVGAVGALPRVSSSGTQIGWGQAVASWFLFAGLALALGGIASERFVWRIEGGRPSRSTMAPVRLGVAIAMVASLSLLALLAHEIGGGGVAAMFGALGSALRSRSGALTLVSFAALVAAAAVGMRWRHLAALPLLAAVLATAWRGHSGSSGYTWAVAANAVHLAAAALWAGALAHLVLVLARRRRGLAAGELADPVRRYVRLALWTVLVIILAGAVTALGEFHSAAQLLDTGYGQILLVKGSLVALALIAALLARTRALTANPGLRLPMLRRLTRAELGLLVAVLIAAGVLANTAPPQFAAAAARAPAALLGPPPLSGPALSLADLAGQLTVGVTATSHELRFGVYPPTESPNSQIRLTANAATPGTGAAGVDLYPRRCGTTCFTLRYALPRGTTTLTVTVADPPWKGGTARIEIPWPPGPGAQALLARVVATMRAIPTLALSETVSSGPGSNAPPFHAIMSGRQLLSEGEAYAAGASDVHILYRRGGLTELAFALPGANIWYRMTIDGHDRVLRETIVDAPAHLIRNTFRYPRPSR